MPQLACGHHPSMPGRYLIVIVERQLPDGTVEGQSILWRELRQRGNPEAFSEVARFVFADWCARRGL